MVELVGGGYIINGATPSSLIKITISQLDFCNILQVKGGGACGKALGEF